MDLPTPICQYGYPRDQLAAILKDRLPAFDAWLAEQTGATVHGRRYGRGPHGLVAYPVCTGRSVSPCGPHGLVVMVSDLRAFLDASP